MQLLAKGNYRARLANNPHELAAAQSLRHRSFRFQRGLAETAGEDADAFDPLCQHVLIEDNRTDALVCCFRLMMSMAAEIKDSYSGQFYDLDALTNFPGPVVEMGRFCVSPGLRDPDILRLAWGAVAKLADQVGAKLLYGCTSFPGSDPRLHCEALALLRANSAPEQWQPKRKATDILDLAALPEIETRNRLHAMAGLPSLLRTYLAMGGWVSDHAVIDRDLDTLHVFTAVEIDRIPAARARALRAIAE